MNIDNLNQISKYSHLPIFYEDILKCWINVHKTSFSEVYNFENIRKQIIWGNKFITFNKKSSIFKNWINSNILFVNDIIDNQGQINEDIILQKLINKTNWISEFNQLKNAIPKLWKNILKSDNSLKSKVKTELRINLKTSTSKMINIDLMTNKLFYSKIIQTKFSNHTPIPTGTLLLKTILIGKKNMTSFIKSKITGSNNSHINLFTK